MPNVELARKTLAHIEELERRKAAGEKLCEHWDQSDWGYYVGEDATDNTREIYDVGDICGTAMCFAGWACRLAGEELTLKPGHYPGYHRWVVKGRDGSISERATMLLDLPDGEWGAPDTRLFDAYNTLDDLRAFVQGLEDGTYTQIQAVHDEEDEE